MWINILLKLIWRRVGTPNYLVTHKMGASMASGWAFWKISPTHVFFFSQLVSLSSSLLGLCSRFRSAAVTAGSYRFSDELSMFFHVLRLGQVPRWSIVSSIVSLLTPRSSWREIYTLSYSSHPFCSLCCWHEITASQECRDTTKASRVYLVLYSSISIMIVDTETTLWDEWMPVCL